MFKLVSDYMRAESQDEDCVLVPYWMMVLPHFSTWRSGLLLRPMRVGLRTTLADHKERVWAKSKLQD